MTKPAQKNKQFGLSLIELLIAMALGIFVTVGILQVFLGTRQSGEVIRAQLTLQESGRFAMYFITRVARQAGYINSGNINDDPVSFAEEMVRRVNAHAKSDESQAGVFPESDVFLEGAVVAGRNNTSGSIDGIALKSKSDVFSIRLQGDPDNAMVDCAGHSLPLSEDEYADITFFVSEDNQLYCNIQNSGNQGAINTSVALVSGIEDMQVSYGVANSERQSRVGRYVNATETNAISNATGFGWEAVLAVRVGFLVVSENPALAEGVIEYSVLDETHKINDRKARQVFSRTIVIRNQRFAKEA